MVLVSLYWTTIATPRPSSLSNYPTCLNTFAFDRRILAQPDRGMDDRLLIVGITEADIAALETWPFNDQTHANFLEELQRHQPAVIGYALYKDLAVPPGTQALTKQLQRSNLIMASLLKPDYSSHEIPPREGIPDDRTGFLNLVVDRDSVVRRHLLFANQAASTFFHSFSLQLATHYLRQRNIAPQVSSKDAQIITLGKTTLPPLRSNCSPTATTLPGYQIPLYYRTKGSIARQVTFTQVLKKQVNPAWVKDKIVLIGLTAPAFQDFANTPYRDPNGPRGKHRLYGVELQAQMVSQLLTAALGK